MKKINISVTLWTLASKEVRRFLRIWVQTLVPPAITMSLYFVIFGSLIGPNIKPEVTDGFAYVQYMIPGLIMMSVITNSYANVVSSFYSVKFQKSIEELLISPMPNWTILLGFIIGGVCRGVLVGIIVFIVKLILESCLRNRPPSFFLLHLAHHHCPSMAHRRLQKRIQRHCLIPPTASMHYNKVFD